MNNSDVSRKTLNRWPRAIARLLDLIWELAIVFPLLYLLVTKTIPITAGDTGWLIAITFVSLPLALLLDAIVAGIFGNTPAKTIAGITVRTFDQEKLGLVHQLKRGYAVWTDGMAMGFLPLTVLSARRQFRKINSGRSTTYDRRLGYHVWSSRNSALRLSGLLAVLLIPPLAALAYTNIQQQSANTFTEVAVSSDDTKVVTTNFNKTATQTDQQPTIDNVDTDALTASAEDVVKPVESDVPREPDQDITEIVLWTNPLSGLSTPISGQFEIKQRQDKADLLSSFNHRASDTTIELEQLDVAANIDQNQIPAHVTKALETINIKGTWINFELAGSQIFESSGVNRDDGVPVSIQATLQTTGSSRRILVIMAKGKNYVSESAELDRLRAAVWSSF